MIVITMVMSTKMVMEMMTLCMVLMTMLVMVITLELIEVPEPSTGCSHHSQALLSSYSLLRSFLNP